MTRFALAVLLTLVSVILVEISLHSSAITAQPINRNYAQEKPTPTPSPPPTPSPSPSPGVTPTPVPEPEPAPSRTPTPSMNSQLSLHKEGS
jgi:outer membrane biosynthesis protein TonB